MGAGGKVQAESKHLVRGSRSGAVRPMRRPTMMDADSCMLSNVDYCSRLRQ